MCVCARLPRSFIFLLGMPVQSTAVGHGGSLSLLRMRSPRAPTRDFLPTQEVEAQLRGKGLFLPHPHLRSSCILLRDQCLVSRTQKCIARSPQLLSLSLWPSRKRGLLCLRNRGPVSCKSPRKSCGRGDSPDFISSLWSIAHPSLMDRCVGRETRKGRGEREHVAEPFPEMPPTPLHFQEPKRDSTWTKAPCLLNAVSFVCPHMIPIIHSLLTGSWRLPLVDI